MCLGCLELNAYASDSNQTSTAYYLAVLLLDLLGLLYQKSLYQFAGLERENESIQMLLAQGDKQYRTARETWNRSTSSATTCATRSGTSGRKDGSTSTL